MYSFIKNFLFLFDPELSHQIALKGLKAAHFLQVLRFFKKHYAEPQCVMGLNFPNPIGLAAGLDKNGDYFEALASCGFGFVEIGTITKLPQSGNPKPRLFRIREENALINRLGFNNKGVAHLLKRVKSSAYQGILGINIGKNFATPLAKALDEYVFLFRTLAPFAHYITVNISSPNTQGLRDLQHGDLLQQLLFNLKKEQSLQDKYVPLVIKISPDLQPHELRKMAHILLEQKIDGVIATNTTIQRDLIINSPLAKETGGLSGKPLFTPSTHTLQTLHHLLQGKIPLIASGGIMGSQDAEKKVLTGASLLQLYTGFIYEGPRIILAALKGFRAARNL